ncbi:MAG: hypothetical protein M3N38_05250 [Pseudomonadota bacterium]|nr:hypothetical protein [Pseudomonadota bacterium]
MDSSGPEMAMRRWLPAVLIALIAAIPTAHAANDSVYTKLLTPEANCTRIDSSFEDGGAWRCPGHGGIDVIVGEGDLRTFVSYGAGAPGEVAAGQTFPAFNTIGDTLEWRRKDGKPAATILRWKIDGGGPDTVKGEVLVVTQLDAGNQCWIATTAVHRNKSANELARKAADELAGTVNCSSSRARPYGVNDPEIVPTE